MILTCRCKLCTTLSQDGFRSAVYTELTHWFGLHLHFYLPTRTPELKIMLPTCTQNLCTILPLRFCMSLSSYKMSFNLPQYSKHHLTRLINWLSCVFTPYPQISRHVTAEALARSCKSLTWIQQCPAEHGFCLSISWKSYDTKIVWET